MELNTNSIISCDGQLTTTDGSCDTSLYNPLSYPLGLQPYIVTLKDDNDAELTLILNKIGAIECVTHTNGDLWHQITINVSGTVYGLKYETEEARNKQYLRLLNDLNP